MDCLYNFNPFTNPACEALMDIVPDVCIDDLAGMLEAAYGITDTCDETQVSPLFEAEGIGVSAARCLLTAVDANIRQELSPMLNVLSWPAIRAVVCPGNATAMVAALPASEANQPLIEEPVRVVLTIVYAGCLLLVIYGRWLHRAVRRCVLAFYAKLP